MALSFLLSFSRSSDTPVTVTASTVSILDGAQIPPSLRNVLVEKCANCHSQTVHRPLYGRFAPVSWLLDHDISEARSHWDASNWKTYSREEQAQILSRLAVRAKLGSMPPSRYTLVHPGAKLDHSERVRLYEWARSEKKRLRSMPSQQEKANAN